MILFYVPVTLHREQSMKTEYQQDATIQMFIINYCLNMFRASLGPTAGKPEWT